MKSHVTQQTTKKIHLVTAVAFAVGAMIGGGVFVLTGQALEQTGPSALISFLVAGLVVLLSAVSFSVIAANASDKYPGYTYVGEVLGSSLWSFLTSWCFYIGGIIATAFVLNAFGTYMHDFVMHTSSALLCSLIAAIILALVNLGPASEIGKIESLLVSVKLIILAVLICFGLAHFHLSNLHPFMPHGSSQILTTSAFLFIAFLGFNVITSISNDIEEPRRTIPRAILLSMLIVTLIYGGVVIALIAAHIHNYSEASVGVAARHLIGPIGGALIVAGALISTLSSANANILGSSEIMVRMAASKEVPTFFGRLRHGHPYASVLAAAILYIVLLLTRDTKVVIELANVTAIIALIVVNIAAAKSLAVKQQHKLSLLFGPTLPILGAISAMSQFLFMPVIPLLIGGILAASGILLYAFRNKLHRPIAHQELLQVVQQIDGPLIRALKKQ
jgi:APA family basic amino acid/polyamine antiporter